MRIMKRYEQLQLFDMESPREAARRRHREYNAAFARARKPARDAGVKARHARKLTLIQGGGNREALRGTGS